MKNGNAKDRPTKQVWFKSTNGPNSAKPETKGKILHARKHLKSSLRPKRLSYLCGSNGESQLIFKGKTQKLNKPQSCYFRFVFFLMSQVWLFISLIPLISSSVTSPTFKYQAFSVFFCFNLWMARTKNNLWNLFLFFQKLYSKFHKVQTNR